MCVIYFRLHLNAATNFDWALMLFILDVVPLMLVILDVVPLSFFRKFLPSQMICVFITLNINFVIVYLVLDSFDVAVLPLPHMNFMKRSCFGVRALIHLPYKRLQ